MSANKRGCKLFQLLVQKEKRHSFVFRNAFQISRKEIFSHTHFKSFKLKQCENNLTFSLLTKVASGNKKTY